MSTVGGALLLMQAWSVTPTPSTIGDTVVLEREIEVADPAARLRLAPIEASGLLEPLVAPEAASGTGGFAVRYTVALFEVGQHAIAMPTVELVYPDGRVETRGGGNAIVAVVSVLPQEDSLPPPRARRAPIPRTEVRATPALLLVTAVVMMTVGWGIVRRRPRRRPSWAVAGPGATEIPISRWIGAGEPRAVATVAMHQMRLHVRRYVPDAELSQDLDDWLHTVESHRPDWPVRELSEIMRALERASFAPAIPGDVIALADEAQVLAQHLGEPAVASPDEEEELCLPDR